MKKLFDVLTTKRYEENLQLLSFTANDYLASRFRLNENSYLDVSLQPEQIQRMLKIIKQIFGYHNYQLKNPYKFHKIIPSARNVHPEIPYVVIGSKVYRYDPNLDSFIYSGESDGPSNFQLLIGLDLGRLCRIYGTFGLALSHLDMGHMIAEFETLLIDGETTLEVIYMFNRTKWQKQLALSSDIFLGSILSISNYHLEKELVYLKNKSKKIDDHKVINYSEDLNILGIADYLSSFDKKSRYQRAGEELPFFFDLRQTSFKRTSANSSVGLLDLGINLPKAKWQILFKTAISLVKRYSVKGDFAIHILIRNQNPELSKMNGHYCVRKGIVNFSSMDISFDDLLYDSKDFFNLEDTSFATFVTYQDNKLSTQEQIYYAHVFSAEIIHHISRFFFAENCYTRPMKNFSDDYLKRYFDLCNQERVIYLLLAGKTPLEISKYIL